MTEESKQGVFILWHVHKRKGQEDDPKLIGVYSSKRQAILARARAKLLPGFREHPRAFVIDKYELGRDQWTSGYSAVTSGTGSKKRKTHDLPSWLAQRLKSSAKGIKRESGSDLPNTI